MQSTTEAAEVLIVIDRHHGQRRHLDWRSSPRGPATIWISNKNSRTACRGGVSWVHLRSLSEGRELALHFAVTQDRRSARGKSPQARVGGGEPRAKKSRDAKPRLRLDTPNGVECLLQLSEHAARADERVSQCEAIRTKPAATHPWRQGYENLRKDATLRQAIKS